jgi:uncharacterized protein (DUF1330 family)
MWCEVTAVSTNSDTRKGYVIFQGNVADWDKYLNEYTPRAVETIEDHGGKVLIADDDPDVTEGDWDHHMTVVIEFPSVEDAREWYNDPEYEEVKPIRHEASEYVNAVICPEFSPGDLRG